MEYPAGEVPSLGLSYPAGRRLLVQIGDSTEQVMDTCESPWCSTTVQYAFDGLRHRRSSDAAGANPIVILERGFGLGIIADYVFKKALDLHAVDYHVIELNRAVAKRAREWKAAKEAVLGGLFANLPEGEPSYSIHVHEGDAFEVTSGLLREGKKFHIIIADTYPLKGEEGVNDLADLETSKHLLAPDGVFTFFAYTPSNKAGGLAAAQRDLIAEHFREYSVIESPGVRPPPEYSYMWQDGLPVQRLMVVRCKKPRL
ncbi:MAG: hypothetical protein SFX73_31445 [Kofleriaceae bacterium]|nr:hypothetical protein [Kofleriaceae bacterium]